MPHEIVLDNLPMGIAAEAKPMGATQARVQMRGYWSTDDGSVFIDRVEGFGGMLLNTINKQKHRILPSQVDHLLAVIKQDRSATVYVNELPMKSLVQVKRAIKAGEAVYHDDIADIQKLDIGVSIPSNAGYVLIMSCNWRKAVLFDFEPLHPSECEDRSYDPCVVFGHAYSELLFQDVFRIDESMWTELFRQRWFPFRALTTATIKRMISHASNGWDIDDLVNDIYREAVVQLKHSLPGWRQRPSFADHAEVLDVAGERYGSGDFVSCVSIVYPRIEGLMRSLHMSGECAEAPSSKTLPVAAVPNTPSPFGHESPLLPTRFRDFLGKVYFAGFDPKSVDNVVSRNSVAHGTAASKRFDCKAATLGMLILMQLSYYVAARHVAEGTDAPN